MTQSKSPRRVLYAVLAARASVANVALAAARALDDGAIIAIHNRVNTFDRETAGLGTARGHDAEVVAPANRVHNDQTGERQMAADLSAKRTIHRSLPGQRAEASAKHAEGLTSLAKLTGLASDKASLQHGLVVHSAAETPVPVAYSTDLRARMGHVLPGFEHHLASTRRVAKTLGYR